jgi:hypothetical protein
MIRYHHQVEDYIYEIEIPEDANHNEDILNCVDNNNAEFKADKYIIRKIIHIPTKKIQKGLCLDECDKLYLGHISYFKTYERALTETSFVFHKKHGVVLREDFPNVFRSYYNSGQIYETFYHVKGKIEGPYIKYTYDGKIDCECNFLNGKLHGSCKIYDWCKTCFCCNQETCENKKDCYEYIYDNGNRLNCDAYFMEYQLENYMIPYKYQN